MNIGKIIIKRMKYPVIFLLVFASVFSDFVSFLPLIFQKNNLAENLKIHGAQAAVTAQFPLSNSVFSGAGFSGPANLYSDNTVYGTSVPGKNGGAGNVYGNFGFDGIVPAGATINSVKIIYEFKVSTAASVALQRVKSRVGGAEQANHDNSAEPLADTIVTVDITADRTWARADLLDGAFEIIAEPRRGSSNTSYTASWDYVKVEVDYTVPVGPDAASFANNTEGALADGGRSGQQITVTGTNFGAGPSDGANNAVKIGTYIVPNGNVSTWNATTIVFTIPAAASVYGGIGANGLIIRAGGADDATPLDFYIYPNITSLSANSGQIGGAITVSGDHFGVAIGTIGINTKIATVGVWGETTLTNVKIPGQEGPLNITGKIQLTRSDAKISNQYPANPSNFTILAPSVTGSSPTSATTGQILMIQFSGSGIDTDTGIAPTLKLTKTGQPDITGTSYAKVTDYQAAGASFNLTGAVVGYWKLVIVNMDTQSGSYGNETTTGFYISPLAPTITGINPGFGNDLGITNIASINGTNFQSGATAKLTKTAQADIIPSTVFSFTSSTTLSSGAFDLTNKTNGWWNVVVANPDLQSASYGNETNSGFEIKSAKPSLPANVYQFKTNADSAQPPATNIAVGGGIGGQTTIYFRINMQGGLTGELYYPQVELKPVGAVFTDTFTAEGAGVMFNGTPVQGWVNIAGIDGASYHWQARVRNSSGVGNWVSFGGNTDPNDIDVYVDNTPPVISPGTDGTCNTAAINITDLSAAIKWNTNDVTSGALTPPGTGAYATAQVQYTKTSLFTDWITTPGALSAINPRENSPHQIAVSSLAPSTNYTYRMRSKDAVGNEGLSANCTFITTSTRPVKTVEFFIDQETAQNTGTQIAKNFSIYIPESPAAEISVKSAFIEITGITSATANQTINIGLLRGAQAVGPAGANYAIDSTGVTTPFTILFDALNPPGTGQQNMSDITTGATNYGYTLFLNGTITPISVFSAKLIITYSYVL